MNDNRKAIEAAFNSYMEQANKFWDNGVKSAGAKARGALMELKQLAHTERAAIQEQKNEGSAK